MQFIASALFFVLSFYLSGVNMLADSLEKLLPNEAEITNIVVEPKEKSAEETLTTLEPEYTKGGTIPQILIDNAAYQKAAVVESITPEKATSTALESLVNIYCTHKDGRDLRAITGTGFFIDTEGIILTNAHVAFFLLLDGVIGETECVIRNGSPASTKYTADILYISPSWVRSHASILSEVAPKGTGERDYALLYVTGGTDNKPMPGLFPALPFDTELLRRSIESTEVYAAGYPADVLMTDGFDTPLIPKLATTTVTELMTFGSNYADIFSISGSSVGERGSSGGPVVTKNGDVIGLISTRGDDELFGNGALRAITLSYIDRTIKEETGFTLRENISGNIPYRSSIFKETMVPFLQLLIEQGL